MPELKMEAPKTPENNWLKILETVSQEKFTIKTSLPDKGYRPVEYKKSDSKREYLEDDFVPDFYYENYENKDILKKVPEVVVFAPDNKFTYIAQISEIWLKILEGRDQKIKPWERPEKDQMFDSIALWKDVHSSPPRSGNLAILQIDLEKDIREQLEKTISQDPVKVREILEKIITERMNLKEHWRSWDPNNLDTTTSNTLPGTMRPPWEFWEKLGLNQMYIQYSDSSKEKPHSEYREIKSEKA